MAFEISWLAFHGKSKSDLLYEMRLRDTHIDDEAMERPMSVARFPDDWTIIVLNTFGHPYAEDASLALFSKGCTVIAGYVHEGLMFSAAMQYQDGRMSWAVSHHSGNGMYDLEAEGTLPPAFAGIKARLTGEQDQAGGAEADTDFLFDVPLDLAASLCGFRHDIMVYPWGEAKFTELEERTEMQ